jgi:hypothetical protein
VVTDDDVEKYIAKRAFGVDDEGNPKVIAHSSSLLKYKSDISVGLGLGKLEWNPRTPSVS